MLGLKYSGSGKQRRNHSDRVLLGVQWCIKKEGTTSASMVLTLKLHRALNAGTGQNLAQRQGKTNICPHAGLINFILSLHFDTLIVLLTALLHPLHRSEPITVISFTGTLVSKHETACTTRMGVNTEW